ncbi:Aste57867_11946 [Aphanomyces stellatus]|uniref:Aste57867_11946 protein n=1 Tax=Aphanomyces stellatus TaxID=120398 RepID=A0A485KVH9_9STRA|nr:hypothetical protein As57867_011901 [Aphanomyces stellatus]VFT88801.1 Aste57867_11946 [Aphanomyces stellatus]
MSEAAKDPSEEATATKDPPRHEVEVGISYPFTTEERAIESPSVETSVSLDENAKGPILNKEEAVPQVADTAIAASDDVPQPSAVNEASNNTGLMIRDAEEANGTIGPGDLTVDIGVIETDGKDGFGGGPWSPSHDPQLAGYPPDCGTKTLKYLSHAKCRRDRGESHPMCYSDTIKDEMGHALPMTYPVITTDFGAHSFHSLPTDSQVLSKYGIGISLYFKFLKVMSWLFLIMFIISLPAMFIYIICGSADANAIKLQLQKNPISILGMTSMGHLGDSESVCSQAKYGDNLTVTCPYGQIGAIKASYSLYASQGTCSCPANYQVSSKGNCRGTTVGSKCAQSGQGCFPGNFPSAGNPCCAFSQDNTGSASFSELMLRNATGCSSPSVMHILNGLCLGQSTCTLSVDDAHLYRWKYDSMYNTRCTDPSSPVFCQAYMSDGMDVSTCPLALRSQRGLIVQATCSTTKIDISSSWAFRIMGWDTITRENFVGTACALDICYSVVFILVVLWMKQQEKIANKRIIDERLSVENYTVQLMHLPKHKDVPTLAEDLKKHLEKVLSDKPMIYNGSIKDIKIADVNFGLTNAAQINVMRKRGEVAAKLEAAQQRISKFKLLEGKMDQVTFDKRIDKLIRASKIIDEKFEKYEKWLDEWEAKNKGKGVIAVTAYITFEEEEGYLRCLREYPNFGFLHRLFQPYHKRFMKKRMWIQTAPNPTDIIWENLDYSVFARTCRVIVVNIIALSLLCISFIIIYAAKLQKNKLTQTYGAPVSCPMDGVTQFQVIQEQTSGSGDQTMVMCYCKASLLSSSLTATMNIEFVDHTTGQSAKYCDTWGTQYLTIQALMVASVLIVVIINACLTPLLQYLVLKQKSHTRSGVIVATVNKIFITQFFNTALIVLFLNANMDDVMASRNSASINGVQIFTGKYSDFTVAWYNDVGVSLMLTMLINMVSPHAGIFITYVILETNRFIDRGFSFDFSITKQETQRDLEALYRGPEFDLATRYSVVINTIFITLLFSSGMPLMLLIGLFSMIVTYWTDKFTFLRVVRRPPEYDGEIARAAGNLLPWAVLLHSLFGIWMYSNTDIFQRMDVNVTALQSINDELQKHGGRIVARAITMPSEVMFALLVAIAAFALVRLVVFRYFASVLRSVFPMCVRMMKESKPPRKLPNYFDAVPTHILKESLATKTLKPQLRDSYSEALSRRGVSTSLEEASDRESHVESEIVLEGCHSYDILVNPIYHEAFGGGAFRRAL